MPRLPKAREPLKQAALRLFVENGVHATGIREIARHAGCSEAALYRHWPNKEAQVSQLFQEHLEAVGDIMREALSKKADTATAIEDCCRAIYELYDSHPLVFRYVLLVQHEIACFLPADLDMPQDILERFFTAVKKSRETKHDPALLSAACIGIFLQTASSVIYGRLEGPLARYAGIVSALGLALLRS